MCPRTLLCLCSVLIQKLCVVLTLVHRKKLNFWVTVPCRDTAVRRSELRPLERSSGMRIMQGAVLSLAHARALEPSGHVLCRCPASSLARAPCTL